jgi:hypothetical protein
VAAFAIEQPAFGQVRVSNELRKRGIFVSPSGVRCVWLRRALESFKKRLLALERHVAETGGVLTEAQVSALEKKQDDDMAYGEVETAHPGYLGSQDTFYVGTIKGVGRIYQQTFVDTYSKWLRPSCIRPRPRLQAPIYSMIECCLSLQNRVWA